MEHPPRVHDVLVRLEAMIDTKTDWSRLDRDHITTTAANDLAYVVLPHLDPDGLPVEVAVYEREVIVSYGPEQVKFTDTDEAIRFVEMLGDGRVRLVVRRALVWNTLLSYRDDLAVPFRKTSEPWLNARPRTETLEFGFVRQ